MKALKELGQNFLIDTNVADAIAEAGDIHSGEDIWEVGPGKGILTEAILRRTERLTAFELDRRLELPLKERFGDRLNLIRADVLRYDWAELIPDSAHKVKLIANIPYQITSPLLSKLEANKENFARIVLMVQSEVADRLTAQKGCKAYGLMTIRMQLIYNISILMRVPRELFDPVPGVDSAVIVMTPREDAPVLRDPELFRQLIHHAFQHRRKTLRNNLLQILTKPELMALEKQSRIDLTRRGETFSEAEFIRLCDLIASLKHMS